MGVFDQAASSPDQDTEETIVKRVPHLKSWALIHKWSSLVCTAFLLLICLTGLPLLFADEINQWLEPRSYESLPA